VGGRLPRPQCVYFGSSNQIVEVRPEEIVIKDTWVTSAHTHCHLYNTIHIINEDEANPSNY